MMKSRVSQWLLATIALGSFALVISSPRRTEAHPSYFNDRCASCHSNDSQTCTGCHHHRGTLTATADQRSYRPGDPVVVTLGGGNKGGWIRALLYNASNAEIDQRSGPTREGDDGRPNAVTLPVQLHGTAPTQPGTYTWQAAWFGNVNDTGSTHGENRKPVTIQVVATTPVTEQTWAWVKRLFH